MKKMKVKIWGAHRMVSQGVNPEFKLPSGLEELTSEETKGIVAGESIGYWLGYAAGKIAQLFS
jgi:hypothetical protein